MRLFHKRYHAPGTSPGTLVEAPAVTGAQGLLEVAAGRAPVHAPALAADAAAGAEDLDDVVPALREQVGNGTAVGLASASVLTGLVDGDFLV